MKILFLVNVLQMCSKLGAYIMNKGIGKYPNPLLLFGTGGRNRTDTESPPRDFESRASTNFTTPA